MISSTAGLTSKQEGDASEFLATGAAAASPIVS